jgi:hypothetical protein
MAGNKKPKSPRKARPGSLLSPESMGGITADKGFDFQTRYAACHVPMWLLEAAFHQLFYEGTGDIDISYRESGQSSKSHIQLKDHEVAPSEFKQVIVYFQSLDAGMPGVYKCFKLVCPSLSAKLRGVETGLARFRNAKPFYDDVPDALAPTKDELDERMRKISLDDTAIAFIHSKVFLDVGHGELQQDERAVEVFVARMLNHPEFAGMIRAMVQPAFAEMLRAIKAKRGATLQRADVEQILRAAVASVSQKEKAVTLWLQNWTKEKFDVAADYELDWSTLFDRSTRRVPVPDIWTGQLLPELKVLKDKITSERAERLIRFRGKCALSTGIALGAAFPAVGGWVFEIPQPPAKDAWRSDANATNPYDFQVELVDGDGTDLVLGLNIRGDGREDVRRYITGTGSSPKIFAFMGPSSPSSQSIRGTEDACAFARAVREHLGQLVKSHGIKQTRLFFYGPFALAVFLGQQLTSVGAIQLFEYQDPGYVPSCTLRT